MAKKDITDLLTNELTKSVNESKAEPENDKSAEMAEKHKPRPSNTKGKEDSIDTESVSTEETKSGSSNLPKYLTLERKEVRLSLEDLDELTAMARRLNRARKGEGERITENTLIRVAVALLVKFKENIRGTTEDELLKCWQSSVRTRNTDEF
jgi:hypothetical protein